MHHPIHQKVKLPEPDIALEVKLGFFEDAENCASWDHRPNYCVYVFEDPLQIDIPKIYIGMGEKSRRVRHWKHTHSKLLQPWIAYWGANGLNVEDISRVIKEGLSQRQAACLETYLITEHKPEANIKYYWTPDQSSGHSEDDRRHHSKKMLGRAQLLDGVKRAAKSRTNKHTLELHFSGQCIKIFQNTSALQISNWILEQQKIAILPSALWATITGRKGSNTKGFKLIKTSVGSELSLKNKLLRAINGKSVVTKNVDAQIRVFVSAAAASDTLEVNEGCLGSVIRGTYKQTKGYTSRYLTGEEISKNIKKWPAHHEIIFDGTIYRFFNITKFRKSKKLVIGTVHKLLTGAAEYSISVGRKIEGSTRWVYQSFEIFDFEMIDDLPIPEPQATA